MSKVYKTPLYKSQPVEKKIGLEDLSPELADSIGDFTVRNSEATSTEKNFDTGETDSASSVVFRNKKGGDLYDLMALLGVDNINDLANIVDNKGSGESHSSSGIEYVGCWGKPTTISEEPAPGYRAYWWRLKQIAHSSAAYIENEFNNPLSTVSFYASPGISETLNVVLINFENVPGAKYHMYYEGEDLLSNEIDSATAFPLVEGGVSSGASQPSFLPLNAVEGITNDLEIELPHIFFSLQKYDALISADRKLFYDLNPLYYPGRYDYSSVPSGRSVYEDGSFDVTGDEYYINYFKYGDNSHPNYVQMFRTLLDNPLTHMRPYFINSGNGFFLHLKNYATYRQSGSCLVIGM